MKHFLWVAPPTEWVCAGICVSDSVVAAATSVFAANVTDLSANTVLKAVVPPELALPDTNRKALSLCVVSFVHPTGAAVCWNTDILPDGIA